MFRQHSMFVEDAGSELSRGFPQANSKLTYLEIWNGWLFPYLCRLVITNLDHPRKNQTTSRPICCNNSCTKRPCVLNTANSCRQVPGLNGRLNNGSSVRKGNYGIPRWNASRPLRYLNYFIISLPVPIFCAIGNFSGGGIPSLNDLSCCYKSNVVINTVDD